MENKTRNKEEKEQAVGKKEYQAPHLFIYGNVREITQNVGNSGAADVGGSGSMQKSMV